MDELYLAFDLAINGKLDIYDHKVYDQFSIEYLVRIMNAYGKYVFATMNEVKISHEPNKIEYKMSSEEKQKDIQEFLSRKELNHDLLPLYIYDWMDELGMLNYDDDTKTKLYARAIRTKAYAYELHLVKNHNDQTAKDEFERLKFNMSTHFVDATRKEIQTIHNIYKKFVLLDQHSKSKQNDK